MAAQSAPSASSAATPKEELPTPIPETKTEPAKKEEPEEEEPILTAAQSEIQLPTVTPKPTPSATATPKPTPKPTAKPTPKATPKPSPKPSPKKKLVAKASPKPSATPKDKEEEEETTEARKKKEITKTALAKKDASDENGKSSEKPGKKTAADNGKKSSSGGDGGGTGSGGGGSEFGWYGNMLHDRFYSDWAQPTTVVATGPKISALVKIRIEKDGTVSSFKIIKPSGNVVVDESVEAVAKRVTQVDPLPAGLGDGDHYDVNINFEVNPNE